MRKEIFMDQYTHEKIVDFAYCGICKHHDLTDKEEPCYSCVANPVNFESAKPTKYEEDSLKVKNMPEYIKRKHLHVNGSN